MLRGRDRDRGRGRGGGNGAVRSRGTFTSAHKSSAAPVKHASAVPAFPVVSRDAAPKGSAASAAPRAAIGGNANANHDDDAPPVAVSARRSRDMEEVEEHGHAGFVPPSATRGRDDGRGGHRGRGNGRGLSRGSGGFRGCRGRGGSSVYRRSGNNDVSRHDNGEHMHEEKERMHDERSQGPTRVITTVTDSGTELPRKLNTKVFIDGLPYTYTPEPGKPTLEDEVMQFATAWKVGKPLRLIKKPGQGFGFLVLQSPNSVATAVRVLNGRKFLGRALRVEEPKPKDLEKMKDIGGMKDMGKDSFTRQVLLTDLAKVAQPEIIREVLRDVAPQLEKKLEAIKMTSKNRKAFLTFESEAEVEPAINFLDGFHLLGRRISATQAAAPGSLPFSHGGAGALRGGRTEATATAAGGAGAAKSHDVEAEEELAVVPLGMEPMKPAAVAAASAPSSSAKLFGSAAGRSRVDTAGTGSNVTGRTEKYNLLDDGPTSIYVGNVGEDVTAAQLRQHFAPCGAIRTCEILVHPETHLSLGIAHIEFALPAYAAYAQERYHGSRLRGCVLRVDRGDTASVPLAAELPPAEPEDDYDEDAYMERHGVKDKKAFFKGTSVAAEVGADADFEEDEDEEDEDGEVDMALASKKVAKKEKRARAKNKKRAAPASMPAEKQARTEELAAEDDEDDEEHFYDADTIPVAAVAAPKSNKGASSGKKNRKKIKPKAVKCK